MLVSSVNYSCNQNFMATAPSALRKGFTTSNNPVIIDGKRYIPKARYNGPILKLTKEEQSRDAQLVDAIATLVIQLQKLEAYCNINNIPFDENNPRYLSILFEIQQKTEERAKIKQNRFAIQRERYEKSHGTGS